MKIINIESDIISRKKTIKAKTESVSDNLALAFNLKISRSSCPAIVPRQQLISWTINNKSVLDLYVSVKNKAISFFWEDKRNNKIGGLITEKIHKIDKVKTSKLKYIPIKTGWTNLKVAFEGERVSLSLNDDKVVSQSSKFLIGLKKTLREKTNHLFQVFGSEEIKINKLRMETTKQTTSEETEEEESVSNVKCSNIKEKGRKKFCQIQLNSSQNCKDIGCLHDKDSTKVEKIYLTPEIYYQVKSCKKKSNTEKNNVTNKYNSNMSGRICISNPLVSFKGFTMDFIVKNLILFGLLFLFQTYLANPVIDTTQKLYVCGVVILLYNLLNIIFVILENIFVWACQYSGRIDELVSDEI